MVHQYKNNGFNMVLDVNSGMVHVVDDLAYDVIAIFENHTKEEVLAEIKEKYADSKEPSLEEIMKQADEVYEEVLEMKKDGQLFTEDVYEPYIDKFLEREPVVKALCLHIAHDCNLACRYCFAEEGEYHGRRALMSFEVGKRAMVPFINIMKKENIKLCG